MKIKMRRLKKLVRALEALPEDIKNRDVCKNVNVPLDADYFEFHFSPFAGLISVVAEDIPALKKYYHPKDEYDSQGEVVLNIYTDYNPYWNDALRRYLGGNLVDWARHHEELWGNDKGEFLYDEWDSAYLASFGKEGFKTLFNYHIINHLKGVCNRYDSLSLKQKISLVWYDIGGWDTVSPFAFFLVFQPVFAFVVLRVTEGTTLPINPFN
ncbi:hypothetical protein [bacterium endosymbiont of Bathymodiolus sp. 5 South]|jgi:hypothetical protein|uniref:hypothetical protein n=1 Tax=bacterium endosymbiont of Bathymodiolus sp. 5 South TaxID=1181670 RepID=UPI0010B08A66|nr:hypothetical protein [bacterium endosymbiont of Bathymodiolus sp. 5 South]SSC06928.1 hypothetical protein BTURTLESOX_1852 [bacterium endosymbiont of Bathymodiolus sp. 5 South]VVH61505.1 hypothetical protein BSPWISOX_1804 [uncultured Gammaproteobacteria bacterium]VVM20726.1 hypothetical protein BSPWISOXPB_934 [uncultured Gammaproteobacteria bacterium]